MDDILEELHLESREAAVAFLKGLWREEPSPCPLCGGALAPLHKKAKKSSSDWRCRRCGHLFRASRILLQLPE